MHVKISGLATMESSSLSQCNLGSKLEDECHKITYSRKQGFLKYSSFSDNEKALIHWRSGVLLHEDDNVCFHHEKVFLSRYESLQRFCADPKSIHKKKISRKYNSMLIVFE